MSRRKVEVTLMGMGSKIMSHERHSLVSLHIRCVHSRNSAVAGSIKAAVAPLLQHKFTKWCPFTSCVCGDIFGHVLSWMGS